VGGTSYHFPCPPPPAPVSPVTVMPTDAPSTEPTTDAPSTEPTTDAPTDAPSTEPTTLQPTLQPTPPTYATIRTNLWIGSSQCSGNPSTVNPIDFDMTTFCAATLVTLLSEFSECSCTTV
jgi:hypothetical protein